MPTGPARTADDISESFQALIDRMIDARFTKELAERGHDVAAAVVERGAEVEKFAEEAWRDTRPMRRDVAKSLAHAADDAGKWWRRSLLPTVRDLWKRRVIAVGAASAAVPELVDDAAVRLGLKEREERHWGAFFLGLLVGAAAGAIVALLTAPRRGEEMRRELGERAEEIATKAKEEWVPIFQREEETNGLPDAQDVTGVVEGAEDASASLTDAAADSATDIGSATGEVADNAADQAADAINDTYDTVDRESPA